MEPAAGDLPSDGVPHSKDLEGVTDSFTPLNPGTAVGKRQKKIAVLTSGGDSAGMNAAGESMRLPLDTSFRIALTPKLMAFLQSVRSFVKVSHEDVRPISSEKDGKDWFEGIQSTQLPLHPMSLHPT